MTKVVFVCFFIVYMFVGLFVCMGSPDLTKNNVDLKYDTNTPLDYIQKHFFVVFFSKKVILRADSFKNLACHVNFTYMSLIKLN